jgi:hypothetical protein
MSMLNNAPRRWVALIIGVFLALCLVNNAVLPIFEASDEASHFTYADYLARERRFPDLNKPLPAHEAAQPPLYYVLTAIAISPFGRSELARISQLNPDWFDKNLNADFVSVKNLHLHTDAENFPNTSTVWSVRAARFFSSILGAITLVVIYAISSLVNRSFASIPHALLPTILVAFNPKFIHVSSIVSNDIAIICAATLSCWWMVRITEKQNDVDARSYFVLGALIGIAVLCKIGALGLFLPAAFVVFRRPTSVISRLSSVLLGFLATAGAWFIYNAVNYGDPLAFDRVRAANEALLRETPLNFPQLVATVPQIFVSYFGVVGIELYLPNWANAIFIAGFVIAVIGCVRYFTSKLTTFGEPRSTPLSSPYLILILWQLALLALYVPWLRNYVGTENGRLVMPGIALLANLVAVGWFALVPQRWHKALVVTTSAMFFLISLLNPFIVIRPAFATPNFSSEQQMVSSLHIDAPAANFDNRIKLLHATLDTRRVKPGQRVGVSLFWGATQPIDQSYRVLIEAIDPYGEVVGRKQFIPFGGRFATNRWQPNLFFRDDYALPIDSDASGIARIQVGLLRVYGESGLLKLDGANADKFVVGRVKIEANETNATTNTTRIATFGETIELNRVRFDSSKVTFEWRAIKQPDKDYTLFVHVLDEQNNLIAQTDAQPFNGEYPTSLWDTNERVTDPRAIQFPANAKKISVGWYDANTGERLVVSQANGVASQDNAVMFAVR